MTNAIRRYASIVIILVTFIALALFPIPECFDCEFPDPYGLPNTVLHTRMLVFEIWSASAIFLAVFLKIKRVWLIPTGIMIADLVTQHLGGVSWESLLNNEGPVIVMFDLVAGFMLMGLAYLFHIGFDLWRHKTEQKPSLEPLANPE